MHELRKECKHTPIKVNFARPMLQICVLYVDEEISINHQLMRRKLIKEHSAKVMRSGKGEVMEERVTDFDEISNAMVRRGKYIFKNYYSCLLKLSKIFPFHLINAVGSIDSVMRIILKEFQYHSSLELDHNTYEAISHIPLATKIGTHAQVWQQIDSSTFLVFGHGRQDLIRTLSGPYQEARALLRDSPRSSPKLSASSTRRCHPFLLAILSADKPLCDLTTPSCPTPRLWRSSSVFCGSEDML
ncbi:MAG: hypothetical protein J3R72DRAFT_501682 [Linnemannia gamsii]|nr:MAG: hypothetical protein J3R72DRAFT_501682 [Linnemannia gamsii]